VKKVIATAPLLIVLLVARSLWSHDFWLVPNAFRMAPGAELVVHGQTSSNFPSSLSAVTPDRVASARLLTAGKDEPIANLEVGGTSLRLTHRPQEVGQALVAVAIHPRTIRESPESFRRYLELEGAPEALARYEREGLMPTDSITRRYAKYAKTLVEVGEGGPRAFTEEVGHPLEFVPLSDPAAARAGEDLRFRMVFRGAPLPHARGHASAAESAESEGAYQEVSFETDADGEFSLGVTAKGLWNVRALHIVPAPAGSGADWDVHWASFVWWTSS
jgi:uncharacterized GH25 family protein